MSDRKDIAVIGGGIGGLLAATLAAGDGARVVLFDAHPIGGRARTHEIDGFRLNQGAHALYEGAELMTALDQLGVAVPGRPPSTDTGVVVDGVVQRFPVDARSMATTGALSGRSRVAAAKLFGALRLGRVARPTGMTVDEWLDERRLRPDLRGLVQLLVRVSTFTNAPDQLDAAAAIGQLERAVRGVRYLDGGWQTIVDGLGACARARGVAVVEGTAVTALEPSAAGWTVVTADGEHRVASVVVAGGGPAVAARLLGVEPDELGVPGPAARVTCLDLGLAAPPRETVLFSTDEPLYCSTHMPPARLGPAGAVVVHAMRYLAPHESPTADEGRDDLWAHARAAGVGQAGAEVLADRYLHAMTVTHGIPLASRGGLDGRPPVAVASRPGAFVAGDWVGPTGLLSDAVAASARTASAAAVRYAATVSA